MLIRRSHPALPLVLALALAGCEEVAGPEGSAQVRVAFGTAPAGSRSVSEASFSRSSSAEERVIAGSNGTLRITDVRMIVAEFELEGPDACAKSDDDGEVELEECEFEAAPFLLDLPLSGGGTVVATAEVPLGTYTELEFEVEDLDEDDDDEARTRAAIAALRSQLSAAFPNFPREASMVVVGSFTPTGGSARPFTVFVDADVEVEMDLAPPLVISQAGASRTLTVQLDPATWFAQGGRVVDLSAFNGRVIELEDEFELGLRGVKIDD